MALNAPCYNMTFYRPYQFHRLHSTTIRPGVNPHKEMGTTKGDLETNYSYVRQLRRCDVRVPVLFLANFGEMLSRNLLTKFSKKLRFTSFSFGGIHHPSSITETEDWRLSGSLPFTVEMQYYNAVESIPEYFFVVTKLNALLPPLVQSIPLWMLRLTLSTTTWFLMSSTPLSLLAFKAPKSGMQSFKRHLRLVNPDLLFTEKGTYNNFYLFIISH